MSDQAQLSGEQRVDTLWRLYDAVLLHLLQSLTADEPAPASLVNVARQFLNDNAINLGTRPDLRRGLQSIADLRNLPFKV